MAKPVAGALDTLSEIEAAHQADIIFLTAMPPRHHARRRALLDEHGFSQPMIATEDAKGEAVAELMRQHPHKTGCVHRRFAAEPSQRAGERCPMRSACI
jgi:hypothetical protein